MRLTVEGQLAALVEETETLGAGAAANEAREKTTQDTRVDVGGVTGVGGLVAAGQDRVFTADSLALLDGDGAVHRIADRIRVGRRDGRVGRS